MKSNIIKIVKFSHKNGLLPLTINVLSVFLFFNLILSADPIVVQHISSEEEVACSIRIHTTNSASNCLRLANRSVSHLHLHQQPQFSDLRTRQSVERSHLTCRAYDDITWALGADIIIGIIIAWLVYS